ncbi:uncharacterized protein TrAtP1_013080 [Trichoderma atroviride]|uniref:uncharacterized protein n=1 Tax=Hypocrea atroviridis TaxID=63577 RepID=UPI00332D6A84|nr:hypothetical protein TrAtP1_013080 [Trichoderma atroviride]
MPIHRPIKTLPAREKLDIAFEPAQRADDILYALPNLAFYATDECHDLAFFVVEIGGGVDDAGVGFEVDRGEYGVESLDVRGEVVDVVEQGV